MLEWLVEMVWISSDHVTSGAGSLMVWWLSRGLLGGCSNLLMSSSRRIIVTGSISVLLTSCCDAAPKTVEDEEAQLWMSGHSTHLVSPGPAHTHPPPAQYHSLKRWAQTTFTQTRAVIDILGCLHYRLETGSWTLLSRVMTTSFYHHLNISPAN